MPGLWLTKNGLWLIPAILSAAFVFLLRDVGFWTLLAVLFLMIGLIASAGLPHIFTSPEERRRERDDRLSDFE